MMDLLSLKTFFEKIKNNTKPEITTMGIVINMDFGR